MKGERYRTGPVIRVAVPMLLTRLCLAAAVWLSFPMSVQSEGRIATISIVSESWDKYANPDGSGLFMEITRAIYGPAGIQMDFEFLPYKRALHRIKAKSADAMYGTYSAEKEGKDYLITPVYPLDKEQTVVIHRVSGSDEWKGSRSLQDRTLAWVRGYDYHLNLPFPIDDVVEVADSEQGLAMLAAGRFDFFLDHAGELRDTIRRTEFDASQYAIHIVHEEKVYMAFSDTAKGQQLASLYDAGFEKLKSSGDLKKIFSRYDLAYPF